MRNGRRVLLLAFLALGCGSIFSGISIVPSGEFATWTSHVRVETETAAGRRVTHLLGETLVPSVPRRIISLDIFLTDSLVALGLRPVAVDSQWQARRPADYIARRLPGVSTVGRGASVDLEAILEAKPDLILASHTQRGRISRQLPKLAPTVFFNLQGALDRERAFLDVGEVLGLRGRATRRLEEFRARMLRARRALAASIGNRPVAFLRFRMLTCVVYSRTPKVGPLLFDQLGLSPDPMVPSGPPRRGWDVLSMERLSLLRAEHLFVVVDADSEEYFREVSRSPLWECIPAVKRGRIHRVSFDTWIVGEGILAYEAMIEEIIAVVDPEGGGS